MKGAIDERLYADLMAEIEALMERNLEEGSEGGRRLRELAEAAERYERRHCLRPALDPIEAIRFRMEQAGLEPRDLAPFIGSRARVSEVLSGRRSLTLPMIRNLHRGLGIPAESLIAEPVQSQPAHHEPAWSDFPIKEMERRGWIEGPLGTPADCEQAVRSFVKPVVSGELAAAYRGGAAHFRGVVATRRAPLLAWTARVAQAAARQEVHGDAQGVLSEERLRAIAGLEPGKPVADALAGLGIALVIEPQLPGCRLDGAALRLQDGRPVLAMTIRYDRLDNFWFTLMHELAHVWRHLSQGLNACYDNLDAADEDPMEQEADQIAADALGPIEELRGSHVLDAPSAFLVGDLAHKLGVHPAAVAGRVRRELGNYKILSRLVGQGEVRKRFPEVRW